MRLIALVASLMVPAQAFALSCVAPTVETSYGFAVESEQSYIIGTGTLEFDTTLLPRSTADALKPDEITRIPAVITGNTFSGKGFDQPLKARIDLAVLCIQAWCPTLDSEQEHLVFMRQTETGLELAVDPCGGSIFSEPTAEMLEQVSTCFKDGNCKPDPS